MRRGGYAGDGDGIGREGTVDEVADGVVPVERQCGAHQAKERVTTVSRPCRLPASAERCAAAQLGWP